MTVDIGKYRKVYAAAFAEAAKEIDEALTRAEEHPEDMKAASAYEQVTLSVVAIGEVADAVLDEDKDLITFCVTQALCAVASIAAIALVEMEEGN